MENCYLILKPFYMIRGVFGKNFQNCLSKKKPYRFR